MARHISAPVWFSHVSAPDDDSRAEALIADQVQEVRINDRACRSALAICSVTTRAEGLVSCGASRSIASLGSLRRDIVGDCFGWTTRCRCFVDAVARKVDTFEVVGLGPVRSHTVNDQFDLLVREMAASLFRKGGHIRPGPAFRDRLAQCVVRNKGQIERVVKGTRCAKFSAHAVTAGAVLGVELVEVSDFSRRAPAFSFVWLTGQTGAAACQQSDGKAD